MAGGLPHARQPVEGRRFGAFDQAVERLDGLQLGHEFIE